MAVLDGVITKVEFSATRTGAKTDIPINDIVQEGFGGDEEPLNGYGLSSGVEDVGAYTRNIALPIRNVGGAADTALAALRGTRVWLFVTRNGILTEYGGTRGCLLKRHRTGGFTSGGAGIVLYTLSMSRSNTEDPFVLTFPSV